ncbi:MAG TPA: DNA-binding transcriptional regulator [Beijerinckiaceae bacterium]|jgi:putative transcriptional regulator
MTGKARKHRDDLAESLHTSAAALHKVGALDKKTMREFDAFCLAEPPPLAPAEIARIRMKANMSQPLFARYLNTSKSTVAQWESGAKRPSGIALRLLGVVKKHGIEVLEDDAPQSRKRA